VIGLCRSAPSKVKSPAVGGHQIKIRLFPWKGREHSVAFNVIALSSEHGGQSIQIGQRCGQDGQMGHGLNARFVEH